MTPTIRLARDTSAERGIKAELEGFLSAHDLSPWCFTPDVMIDETERIPHSHPVLTLNTHNHDEFLLAGYLHEQLHWFCAERRSAINALAEGDLKQRYPKVPVGYPQGCRDEDSTYLHLVVCWQEHDALRTLLGEEEANRATQQFAEIGVYRWVYSTILNDFEHLRALYEPRGLRILP
jgi:hypothetical protein